MIHAKHLYKKALITSPLISLYGVAPVHLFASTPLKETVFGFFGLSLGIFFFWFINLLLVRQSKSPVKRYVSSYAAIFFIHMAMTLPALLFANEAADGSKLAYSMLAGFAVNTVILVIIDAELTKQQKEAAEAENTRLKISNLEAQKKALIQQLQPHFLFNTLSTLKALIRENPGEAEDYTLQLSDFLRYTVRSSSQELASLQEELDFAKDYLALQKKRFGEALHCSIALPEAWLQAKLPIFALQTLIENAIKHNRISDKQPLNICIEAWGEQIKVSNNRSPKVLRLPSGTGLANLNERYTILLNSPISIEQTEQFFTVYLNLLK